MAGKGSETTPNWALALVLTNRLLDRDLERTT
jgi:hypothetical protein